MPEHCRSCKAPIRWAVTVIAPSARQPDEVLYVAHFRTCPYADRHRKR